MVDLQVTAQKLQDRGERILMELLSLEREAARALLRDGGGHVKTALVMGRLGLGAEEARARLLAAGGRVAQVVGEEE
jgi:N-acetylmuramic acid 6-phosphate etherase